MPPAFENRTRTNVVVPSRRAYAARTLRPIHFHFYSRNASRRNATRMFGRNASLETRKFRNNVSRNSNSHERFPSFSPRVRCTYASTDSFFSTRVVYKFANATISIMPAHSFSPRMRCIRRDGLPPQRPRLFSTFRRDGLRLFSTSRYPPASAWDKLAPSGGMRTTRASHPRRRIIIASNAALIALTNHFYTSRLFFRFVSQIPGIQGVQANSLLFCPYGPGQFIAQKVSFSVFSQ